MRTKTVNMLSGSITKGLLSMTIPIMIMNTTQVLFNAIDMMMLKNHGTAVGAVGACSTISVLCTSLLIGISVGANVIIAKRIGSREQERTDKAASTAMITALLGGLLLMIIGLLFSETFLKWTNCPETILAPATTYFKLYFYSMPALMVYNFSAAILRSIGDTKRPMYCLVFGGITKVLFTYIFVFFCNMTVEGVGYATIISNIVACVPAVYTLLKRQNMINISLSTLQFSWQELKDILYIGVPAGLQSSMYCFANVVILSAVNGFGPEATTGVSIANQFDGILYQIVYAPSLAVAPYVAQNIGAKNTERVKETFIKAMLITFLFGTSLGALSAIFSKELASLMSNSPAAIAFAQQKMIIISGTYFICGINEVFCGVLKGMGKPLLPTLATFVFMCVLRFIWVYAIFPYYPNLTFLYAVWPIGWVLSIITLSIDYGITFTKMKRNSQPQA